MIKNIVKFGVSEGLVKLAPIITVLFLANVLEKEKIGILAILVVAMEMLYILVSNNIQATTRVDFFKMPASLLIRKTYIKLQYSLITWLLFFLLSISAIFYFNLEIFYLFLLPVPFLKTLAQLKLSFYQCSKNSNSYLTMQVIYITTYVGTFLLLYQTGIFAWAVSLLIATLSQSLLHNNHSYLKLIRVGVKVFKRDFRKLNLVVREGMAFLPQAIGWWARSALERYIVGLSFGLASLGVYSFSSQFSIILTFIVTAINLALLPEINTNIKNNNFKYVNKLYFKVVVGLVTCCIIMTVLSILFTKYFYSSYYDGKWIIVISMVAALLQAIFMIVTNELYFNGKGGFVAKFTMIIFFLQSVVVYFLSLNFSLEISIFTSIIANLSLLVIIIKALRESRLSGFYVG